MFFDKHRVKLSYQKCLKKSSNNSPIQRKKNSIIYITTILITSTWSTCNQVPGCSVHCTPGPSERCIKYTEFSAGKLAYTSRWMRSWWWWMVIIKKLFLYSAGIWRPWWWKYWLKHEKAEICKMLNPKLLWTHNFGLDKWVSRQLQVLQKNFREMNLDFI